MKSTAHANVNFTSGNWVNNLTPKQQCNLYEEVLEFLNYETLQTIGRKYNEAIALKYKNV